jgi:hypothetical protein
MIVEESLFNIISEITLNTFKPEAKGMRKSFLVITIACVSILAASFAQQSQASQPAPQPAQTPAGAPVASTCPTTPAAPTITGTITAGTTEIKGKAIAPLAGCPSEIQVRLNSESTPLALAAGANPAVSSDGTFSVKLQNPLTEGQTIAVTQAFINLNATPPASLQSAVASFTAQAVPTPTPTPTPAPTPQIAGMLREGANAITGVTGKLPTSSGGGNGATCSAQLEAFDVSVDPAQLLQLSGGAATSDIANGGGGFNLTLQEPMRGGQVIRVDEITQNCTGLPSTLSSQGVRVVVPGDWGRVKGYFVSGILLSQNQNSFSQSSLFLGFNLDKTWRMPGYYHQKTEPWKSATEALKSQAVEKQATATEKLIAVMGCDQNDSPECTQLQHAKGTAQAAAQAAEETESKTRKINCDKTKLKQEQKQACDATRADEKASQAAAQSLSTQTDVSYRHLCGQANLSASQKQGCADVKAARDDASNTLAEAAKGQTKHPMSWKPGFNTFFDVRLTSIPVSACNLQNGSTGTNGGSCASPSPTPTPAAGATVKQAADATPSPTPLDTFLSQSKAARFTVGAYLPFTITTWNYNKQANALFIAPLAKVGFDTPVGDLTQIQTTTTPAGATLTPTAVNQANFYNFYGYGGRVGHYALTKSRDEAPELVSYLDLIVGRYSNLETLIEPEKGATAEHPVKRMRLYRLGLEGILKIPTTPLIIGFSANVGQESLGLGSNTIVQRAGDDLRFLFGARFDAAKLMSVIAKAAP